MNKFYVIEPEKGVSFRSKWAYADVTIPVNYGNSQKCSVCDGAVSGIIGLFRGIVGGKLSLHLHSGSLNPIEVSKWMRHEFSTR